MALTLCSLNASIHRFTRVRCTAISFSSIGMTFPFFTKFFPIHPLLPLLSLLLLLLATSTFVYRHDFSLFYKILPLYTHYSRYSHYSYYSEPPRLKLWQLPIGFSVL